MHRQTHSLKAVSQSSVIRYLLSCASDSFQIHKKLFFFFIISSLHKEMGGGNAILLRLVGNWINRRAAGAFCFRSGVTTFPTDSTSLHRDEKTLFSLVQFTLIHPPPYPYPMQFQSFSNLSVCLFLFKEKISVFFLPGGVSGSRHLVLNDLYLNQKHFEWKAFFQPKQLILLLRQKKENKKNYSPI